MTIKGMCEALGLTVLTGDEQALDREVRGCYICDLLSWVMGRCQAGEVWITIQTNQNVIAVAHLCEAACVLLPEGVKPDGAFLDKANQHGIVVLSGEKTAWELGCAVKEICLP